MWKLTPLAAIALIGLIAFSSGNRVADAVDFYLSDVSILEDPGGHGTPIGMPEKLELKVIVDEPDFVSIEGPEPWVAASGIIEGGQIFAQGTGIVAGFEDIVVLFQGQVNGDGLEGQYTMGAEGGLPGGLPIVYLVEPQPPPVKLHSITVLKLNDENRQPLPGWEMNLYDGSDCSGTPIDSATTGGDGLADFTGLPPGLYSVLEKPQPGWNPVGEVCQPVDLGGVAGSAGDFARCPIDDLDFPLPGCDEFDSGAQVNVEINFSGETDTITLNGPTVIQRSAVDGQVAGGGRNVIQTEIVQLDLSGFSALLGPVEVRQSPDTRSLGEIEEQENDTPGEMDFPADSFFDVFFEIELEDAGLVLHNEEAFRLECKIDEIPPFLCFYQPPVPDPIDLLGPDGAKVAKLVHGVHIPLPPKEVLIVFRNAPKPDITPTPTPDEKLYSINVLKVNDEDRQPLPGWEMNLYDGPDCSDNFIDSEITGSDGIAEFTGLPPGVYSVLEKSQPGWNPVGDPCQPVELGGAVGGAGDFADCPIDDLDFPLPGCDEFDSGAQVNIEINVSGDTSAVTLNGPTTILRGPVGDDEPNGLDDVQTEIIQLDLTGVSPLLGPVVVRQSPDRRSLGAIEEQENRIQGPLDFPAESFFDVFFEIELPDAGLVLHNGDPFRLECKIAEIPPILCFYQPPVPDPIELYNEAGAKIATIVHGLHIPLPPKKVLIVFRNRPKPGTTPTLTPTPLGPPNGDCEKADQDVSFQGETWDFWICMPDPVLPFSRVDVHVGKATQDSKLDPASPPLFVCGSTGEKATGVFKEHLKDVNPDPALPDHEVWSGEFQQKCQDSVDIYLKPYDPTNHPVIKAVFFTNPGPPITPIVTPTRPIEPTVTATPLPPSDGDVNKDGTTNSIDASLVLQFEAGIITAVDHPENADVNRNGQINSIDATLILQLDAGLIPSLPV